MAPSGVADAGYNRVAGPAEGSARPVAPDSVLAQGLPTGRARTQGSKAAEPGQRCPGTSSAATGPRRMATTPGRGATPEMPFRTSSLVNSPGLLLDSSGRLGRCCSLRRFRPSRREASQRLPMRDLTVSDNWVGASATRGTGSNAVLGQGVFVPPEPVVALGRPPRYRPSAVSAVAVGGPVTLSRVHSHAVPLPVARPRDVGDLHRTHLRPQGFDYHPTATTKLGC
jgi:hypothetical protein